MLKVLLKKQLAESFKGIFFDSKKGQARSKSSTILWIIVFGVLLIGVLGGMFFGLAMLMCEGLISVNMGWLYFDIMALLGIVLGTFGSVFSTFTGLYLGKDNDLLLSMPIPVKYIVISRLLSVYIVGTLYSALVMIPALIVYGMYSKITLSTVVCGIVLFLIVTLIVLILSCLLGFVVAKISQKLKNKSFVTVALSLIFIAAYYVAYYKANDLIRDIVANAEIYGEKIKGSAYWIYLFGTTGEGNWAACAIFFTATVILMLLTWLILSKTFLSIAISSGPVSKAKELKYNAKQSGTFKTLLGKEFAKFKSSPNYMLNCGLGILFIPACAVLLLIKGNDLKLIFDTMFGDGFSNVIFCAMLCMCSSMVDSAAPATSLEGKSIWIVQSMPCKAKDVLRAKETAQIILSGIPMTIAVICVEIICKAPVLDSILIALMPIGFLLFSASFSTAVGVRFANLTWTNEIVPIKQGAAVAFSLFGGWILSILFAGLFFLLSSFLAPTIYLLIWTVLIFAAFFITQKILDKKCSETFAFL